MSLPRSALRCPYLLGEAASLLARHVGERETSRLQ